ncbi:MAG: SurA N-terminal domain-containing protein [Kiritimatiellae bacterium]|nr:SurA N-terminal domain-containing protein [Kiritimatiellia bacterium]
MKTAFLFVSAALVGTLGAATLDGLAAKVNDVVITVGDVMADIQRNPRLRGHFAASKATDAATLYSETLEMLIDRKLILQAAAEKKMEMQEWVVDNRIREIVKDGFDGDMNKLTATLAQSKVALTDWRNAIRDDMIIQAMRYQLIEKNLQATPLAMRKEYKEHRARYMTEAKTTVSVILLRPPRDGDKETPSVTTRGEEIIARLEKGEDFADLARRYSSDSHAKDGGQWKDVKPEEAFRPEIAAAIAKLKVGEFSTLVNLDGWGFIVRKDEETVGKQLSFAEAYDAIARNVKNDAAKAEYDAWMKRLRAQAFVKKYPMPEDMK